MIVWGAPWAFLLLLPVLALPFQPWLTGRNRLLVAGPASFVAGWTLRRALYWLPSTLRLVGLVFVVFAMARPKHVHRTTIIESEGLDIMLAIDTSGSMRAEDFATSLRQANRLEVAKAVLGAFVDDRPYDRLGIVVFGEQAFTHVPLTLDHDTLSDVLASIEIGVAGENRTAIGSAVAVAAKRLKELDAPERIVILLTDGQSNAGRLAPVEAAELAAAVGVKVYTIGIGAPPRRGIFGITNDGLDENTLRAVAETTGGRYFRAKDARSLQEIYATIDELEPSPAQVEELVDDDELYRYALVPGTGLLLAYLLLAGTWLRRGP